MKRSIYILAVAALVISSASCQNLDKESIETDSSVFSAVIDDVSTRTTLKNLYVRWENTDKVDINGIQYAVTPEQKDSTKAVLSKSAEADPDPKALFKAIYPASLKSQTGFELPDTLTYNAGKFNIPMYAESSNRTLSFKNIFAVLKVSVPSTVTVKKIEVSSDLYINGAFTVSDNKAVISSGTDSNKTTLLDCGTGVSGTDFFIPVPAGTYTGKNLKVVLTRGDDSMVTMKTDQSATIAISANTIYTFNFLESGAFKLIESSTISTLL